MATAGTTGQPGQETSIRRATTVVVVIVAGIAAYISYRHAYELATANGETASTAHAWPLTVDGLIFAASMVLLRSARTGSRPPLLAYVGLTLGIVATLGANVAHGLGHGPIGALVAAWPAVALVMSYELLMWLVRTGTVTPEPDPIAEPDEPVAEDRPKVAEPPIEVAGTLEEQVIAAYAMGVSQRRIAKQHDITRHRVADILNTVAELAEESPVAVLNGQTEAAV